MQPMRSVLFRAVCSATILVGSLAGNPLICRGQSPFICVLGVAQDGGYPQASCEKDCCKPAWNQPKNRRFVSCIAVVDPESAQRWIFDCTPDFREQLRLLDGIYPRKNGSAIVDGILLTHAHIGHYSGLIHLGREVLGTQAVPVYGMPRMKFFLERNGPWSQLVDLNQIKIRRLVAGESVALNPRISVTPFLVPHRDEFSETVGFKISCGDRHAAFLPDIDKWEKWGVKIEDLIADVDIAFLDGTFFNVSELPGRDMSEIPHPFVSTSIDRFRELPKSERAKVYFTHFNHSNPLNRDQSPEKDAVHSEGLRVAVQGARWSFGG